MTSLVPGMLFKNSGLNQAHTPTEVTAKPELVKAKYRRSSLEEGDWPPDSPVARVYDINNCSSKLILLNNKMDSKSHLRVQSGRYQRRNEEEAKSNKPERHFRAKSACNQRRHVACQDSSSPVYQVKQSDHAPTKSRSQSSREPRGRASYSAGWPKPSEWHHYSSQISRSTGNRDSPHRMRQNKKKPRSSSEPVPPPSFKHDKDWLLHSDMTKGQKLYVNSIARVYDMTNMKQLKQAQYVQLIHREQQRGFFTPENYKKYLAYLHSNRIRLFNVSAAPSMLSKRDLSSKSARSSPRAAKQSPQQSAPRSAAQLTQERGAGEEKEDKLVSGEDSSKQSTDEKRDNDSPRERPSPRQRPKSSKFTRRQEAKPKDEPKQEQKNANSNSDQDDDSRQYWKQPDPPAKEKEPDGSGLVMDAHKTLRNEDDEEIKDTTVAKTTESKATDDEEHHGDNGGTGYKPKSGTEDHTVQTSDTHRTSASDPKDGRTREDNSPYDPDEPQDEFTAIRKRRDDAMRSDEESLQVEESDSKSSQS